MIGRMDDRYMAEALELAARGRGNVSPNPMVGAVLVKNGRVVGRGWHARFGGPHHNAICFGDARRRIRAAAEMIGADYCEM